MRIAIDIRSTTKKKTGIGYYTFNLVNNLASIDRENNYILYSKIGYFNRTKRLLDLPANNFSHCVNRLGLSSSFLLNRIDILHSSSYDIKKPKGVKLVLVIHDVIHRTYPEAHSLQTLKTVEERITNILPQADWIITDTNTVKEDFLQFYNFPETKISVIYPGVDEEFFQDVDKKRQADLPRIIPKAPTFKSGMKGYVESNIRKSPAIHGGDIRGLLKRYNIEGPFILFIGTLEPRKNITGLIEAFSILKKDRKAPHKLVIIGMRGWMYEQIFKTVSQLNLLEEVIFTDYLPQEDKRCLLRAADVFVYPSFYEGVGLPVLEAFASGVCVVTSNNSSLKEIACDCALLVNPDNPSEIADAMLKIITDDTLKRELKEKGLKRAKEFSWQKTAEQTLRVFNNLDLN